MNPRQKSMIIGGVLGAVMGVLGGYLFTRGLELPREEEEPQRLSLRSVPPGEMVKLFIAIMGVLRGVAELGERM
jgi:galactitol-specific phosphotransferase system IIC component